MAKSSLIILKATGKAQNVTADEYTKQKLWESTLQIQLSLL